MFLFIYIFVDSHSQRPEEIFHHDALILFGIAVAAIFFYFLTWYSFHIWAVPFVYVNWYMFVLSHFVACILANAMATWKHWHSRWLPLSWPLFQYNLIASECNDFFPLATNEVDYYYSLFQVIPVVFCSTMRLEIYRWETHRMVYEVHKARPSF